MITQIEKKFIKLILKIWGELIKKFDFHIYYLINKQNSRYLSIKNKVNRNIKIQIIFYFL